VVSTAFNGVLRLQRQRMVKEALHEWFSDGRIHALSIRALTPDEYFHQL
jgi:bolA protein